MNKQNKIICSYFVGGGLTASLFVPMPFTSALLFAAIVVAIAEHREDKFLGRYLMFALWAALNVSFVFLGIKNFDNNCPPGAVFLAPAILSSLVSLGVLAGIAHDATCGD